MNKIKDWIIGHKKASIAIGIISVFIIAIGSIIWTFNTRQVADSRKQVETVDTKSKKEALAKKVEEAKKTLEEKVENLDKLSAEDKNQLETVKKQLAEAIEKKDEATIAKYQNELKSALNTAKTNVEKIVAEEKAKAEEVKKEEEKKVEENKPTENTTENHSTSQAPASNQTEQQARPQVEASKPAEESKPAPAPQPEAPKPVKYCEYSGNRKPVQNICETGNPFGRKTSDRHIKKWVARYENGEIKKMVFHGETDRYHLIKDEDLRKGLAETPEAECYIGGSCFGFNVSGR